ncbi:MADS-box transcription factor PHERES like [Actinidia chinensis var. chinensis]|uniref:MADS-box transcription factor PHERES like n=1 Tax=Actinidia chinensis var. chinensis TaxID=1590841 RepID=A0A2R6QVS5_ACTCC|nr:MADS-box transcription factor PHERES like [Actinidia chinensis var. chinensis]
MFKKIEELSVLSDVRTGAIVYSLGEANPAVFPSYEAVKPMFEKFLSTSIVERTQKMVTHESYLSQRVTKETEKKITEKKKNDRIEAQEIMNKTFEGNGLNDLDIVILNNLTLLTVDKLKELEEREQAPREQVIPPPPPPATDNGTLEVKEEEAFIQARSRDEFVSSSVSTSIQQLMDDHWFMETMALHQELLGPSEISDIGYPPEYAASTSTSENEEKLPKDLHA